MTEAGGPDRREGGQRKMEGRKEGGRWRLSVVDVVTTPPNQGAWMRSLDSNAHRDGGNGVSRGSTRPPPLLSDVGAGAKV